MGVTFGLQAAEPLSGGQIRLVADRGAKWSDEGRQLWRLVEGMDDRRRGSGPRAFPWCYHAFDWNEGREPTQADCARPQDILKAVQSLERDLYRSPKRHPPEWKLWLQRPDGTEEQRESLKAQYRGKPCRLFTDEQGAWAVEADAPDAYPLHYPLSDLPEVRVHLEEGVEATVRIERISAATAHQPVFDGIKRLCVLAMQKNLLLLPCYA